MLNMLNLKIRGYVSLMIMLCVFVMQNNLLHAQSFDLGGEIAADPVQISATLSDTTARPGDQRVIAVVAQMAPTYHINPEASQIPSDLSFLIPTTVSAEIGDAPFELRAIQYPKAHEVKVNFTGEESILPAYEGKTVFYIPFVVKQDAKPGDYPLQIVVDYQTCNDRACLAPTADTVDLTLKIISPDETSTAVAVPTEPTPPAEQTTTPPAKASSQEVFKDFDAAAFGAVETAKDAKKVNANSNVMFDVFGFSFEINSEGFGLLTILLVAMAGGFLLNLTPCVLPVIPIKIMGLSKAAGNRLQCFMLGVWMSVGVVAFWLILGGFISSLAHVKAISVLFQYWWFTIGVGVFIAVMAVGMCGVFAIRLPQWVYQISPKQETVPGSIGFGIMTAILSTPCTAPFMGGAAAWSLDKSFGVVLLTFASIGFGMALPYLLLAANPKWVESMPRTGPASELIKQVMGLLMLAAASYFIGVGMASIFSDGTEQTSQLYWWPVMGFIAMAGAWLAYKTWRITPSSAKRIVWSAVGCVAIVSSVTGAVKLTEKGPIEWVYYTPAKFEDALSQHKVVVLDFTAEWCLNCKTLENTVLSTESVVDSLEQSNVVAMKVDLTSKDNTHGWNKLAEVNRATIPYLVVYSPNGQRVFESDWYTAKQVVTAIEKAEKNL